MKQKTKLFDVFDSRGDFIDTVEYPTSYPDELVKFDVAHYGTFPLNVKVVRQAPRVQTQTRLSSCVSPVL